MPKPLCRHIGRCRDIGVRRGGRCRAFSFWTGASSVSCRGGPQRRRAPNPPMGFPQRPQAMLITALYYPIHPGSAPEPTHPFDLHSRATSYGLEIWHRGPINGPKSPRFPDSRPRTRVFDNSTHPAVLFLSTKKVFIFPIPSTTNSAAQGDHNRRSNSDQRGVSWKIRS